jgi:hypothetical protein
MTWPDKVKKATVEYKVTLNHSRHLVTKLMYFMINVSSIF